MTTNKEVVTPDVLERVRQNLQSVVRTTVCRQVAQFSGCELPLVEELCRVEGFEQYAPGDVLASEMVLVAISGPELQLMLKIHFHHNQAQARLRPTTDTPNPLTAKDMDYMKELCNQVGGALCRLFSTHDVATGLSVPLCTRGYYEIYADYRERAQPLVKLADAWSLQGEFGNLYVSCYYEINDNRVLPALEALSMDAVDSDDDEIDFL